MSNIDKKHIIKHFRTSTSGYVVSPDNIEIGEIAMNYNSESPMLMFKDNEGNIQKVGSVLNVTGSSEYHTMSQKSITDAINDKFDSIEIPEVALSETYEEVSYPEISDENIVFKSSLKGDSLDTAVNKLDSNISLLVSETLKNETVVAAAFTEIKENVGLDENLKYISDDSANFISGATTFAEADSLLDAAIEEVRSSIPSLDNYYNKTEVNELIDEITTGDIQLTNYYTKNEVDELIPSVPTSNTAFTNDAGYITLSEVPKTDLSEYAKKSELEGLASETYVNDQISNLVSGAPSVLDTLDELAKALNDDANFATTVTNQIAEKADKEHTHAFESITDKPTTLGGYGIVDAKIEGKTITLGENSLDVSDTILSESYEEISYPEVSDNVIFNPSLKGDSLDTAVNKLDSNISLLVSETLKNETVIAAALTEIKENVGLDENLKYISDDSANFINGATTLAEADSLLDAAIEEVRSSASLKDHTHAFENITDKPTTLGGYGIVDAKIEGKTITLGDNSLDVSEAVLSESYEEVVYPTVKNENIVFESSQSGDSLDTAVNKLDSNISLLVSEVLKDEKVMAKSITDIKENVGLDKNLKYIPNENAKYISNATTFAEADMLLDEALQNFSSSYVLNLGDIIIEGSEGLEYSDSLYAELYGTIDSEINEKIYSTISNNGSLLIYNGEKIFNIEYYKIYNYDDNSYEYELSLRFNYFDEEIELIIYINNENNVYIEQVSYINYCLFSYDDIDISDQDEYTTVGTLKDMYIYDMIYTVLYNYGIIKFNIDDLLYPMYICSDNISYGDNLIFATYNFEYNSILYFEICFDGTVNIYNENIFNANITDEYTDRVDEFIELYNETNVPFIAIESGMNLDTVADSLESNFLLLVNEIKNNETVVAKSITEIKENVGLNENLKYISDENAEYISGATTFAEADSLLDAAIRNMSNGGYIFIEKFDKNDFQNALTLALESLEEGESAILDCTYFKGKHTITEGFIINNPVSLIFGGIDVEFNNSVGENLFTFNSNNISIQGINRNTDKTQTDNGATVFRMLNVDNSLEGYHIKSRGNKNLEIKNITLVGLRTTMGHQYGNSSYDIDGVGGIYIEKAKPEIVEGGNTCNNVRIENVLIAGTKAHGIYLDTPILSSIKNVRLSDCGGHGIFINGGTSILFENTYVSSSDMAGFCIYGSSYVSLNNCVAENGGIGFWIRSSFNVTMTSPGVEATKNHGANPWRYSQPITNKYGLNLSTLSSDGSTSISIPDVNSDASSYFRGYGILISGGKSINVFTPYIKSISQPATNAGYPNGAENTSNVKYINVIGDARSVYISNPSFKEMDNSTIPSLIKHEIGIEEDVINLELVYNTEQTTLKGTLDNQYYVTDNAKRAPIYCKSTSALLRNGKKLITIYQAETPIEDLDLANKKYVDDKFNNIEIPEVALSESYVSVVYDSDTGDKTFTPAVAGQTLDEAIYTVESNVSTLVTSVLENEEVTSAAITEVKVSVGLDENLKYVTNSSAAYISSATNVSEALNILDNAVLNVFDNMPDVSVDAYTKSESDSKYALKTALDTANKTINSLQNTVSNLQTTIGTLESKINAIISAVGLNNDGTFIVPTTAQTSGYTTAATSVMSAIHLMDNQIEENETVAAYALTDLNNRLEINTTTLSDLDSRIVVNEESLTNLNNSLNDEIDRVNEFEEVNAATLTDLNERITNLELS